MKLLIALAFSTALLTGCSDGDADNRNTDTAQMDGTTSTMTEAESMRDPLAPADGPMSTPTDAAGYLAKASASDLFEIESSRAIMDKTDNAEVKKFAQMMIDGHTQSTEKLKTAAQSAGMTVSPPMLEPAQQAQVDRIKSAEGDEAVEAYIAAQREAHDAALALHQGYAQNGDTPALKTAAGEIAPVVQGHIQMLEKLPGG